MTLDDLRRRYPGWAISRSGTGGYWANLFGDPTLAQQAAGAVAFVGADNLDQLDDELDRQEKIRRSNP